MPLHPLWRHYNEDNAYSIAGTEMEYQSEAEPTKDTPQLALMGEQWGVFCEYFDENWPRYNGTASIGQGRTQVRPLFHSDINIYSSIGSDNGLTPTRRQAMIWTNGG